MLRGMFHARPHEGTSHRAHAGICDRALCFALEDEELPSAAVQAHVRDACWLAAVAGCYPHAKNDRRKVLQKKSLYVHLSDSGFKTANKVPTLRMELQIPCLSLFLAQYSRYW